MMFNLLLVSAAHAGGGVESDDGTGLCVLAMIIVAIGFVASLYGGKNR